MNTLVSIVCSQASIPEGPEYPTDTKDDLGSLPLIPSHSAPPRTSCERLASKYLRLEAYWWGGREWSVLNWTCQPAIHPQGGEHMEPSSFLSPFLLLSVPLFLPFSFFFPLSLPFSIQPGSVDTG